MADITNLLRRNRLQRFEQPPVDIMQGIGEIQQPQSTYPSEAAPVEEYPEVSSKIPSQTPTPPEPTSIEEMLARYKPDTVARDRFDKLLSEIPQREEPSIMRRIVAGGMGLGSKRNPVTNPQQTMENVMYAPYMRDVAAWKEKVEPFDKAAQRENAANNINRQVIANAQTVDAQLKRAEMQQKTAEEKNRIARIIALARDFKYRNPDLKIVQPPGGYIMGINSMTGAQKYILDDQGEKIKSGTMTEEALANLEGEWDEKAAKARAGGQVDVATIRGTVVFEDEAGHRYELNPNTKQINPIGNAPENPTGGLKRITGPGSGGSGADNEANMLEKERIRQQSIARAYETYAEVRAIVSKQNNGTYQFKNRPVLGASRGLMSSITGDYVTQAEVDNYDDIREKVDPTYKRPPKGESINFSSLQNPSMSELDSSKWGPGGPGTVQQVPGQAAGQASTMPNPGGGRGVNPTTIPGPASTPPLRGERTTRANPFGGGFEQAPALTPLQRKAYDYLKANGQNTDPKNIEFAIAAGWVK